MSICISQSSLLLSNRRSLIKYVFSFIIFVTAFYSLNTYAHPHSWIDLKTLIRGDQTKITGFKMSWTFDPMTSAYTLDGEDLSIANKEETLKKLAGTMMKNINMEHYFTYFYDGETPIKFAPNIHGKLTMDKTKLTLDFELPLSKPKLITEAPLKLLIFESSYYMDMSWLKKEDIQLSEELGKRCSLDLILPNPTPEQVTYAMSLPADADPDDQFGQLFTQTLLIKCKSEKVDR